MNMSTLKLVGWDDFDCEYPTIQRTQEEIGEMVVLIVEDILKNGYMFSGNEHQYTPNCTPIFSDGTAFRASMRSWGQIMASAYSTNEKEPEYTYMDFYMNLENSKYPDYTPVDIEPLTAGEFVFGSVCQNDINLISQALSTGMGFMTTDKVLSNIYNALRKDKK